VGWSSLAPLILSSSVAIALSRLIMHGLGTRVLVPVLVGIVVADVVTAVALRLLVNVFLAFALGWAVSLWALLIAVDPSLFNPLSSHFLHGGVLSGQLRAAQSALASDGTPLPLLSGMVGIVGTISALGAALTRAVWGAQRRLRILATDRIALSPCLAPSLAIFVYSSLVSAERGRVPAFICYFLGVLAFVALADRATSPSPSPIRGRSPAWARLARRIRFPTGAVAGCVAVALVAVALGAGLSGMRLTVFHVNPAPQGPSGRSPSGQSLSGQSAADQITGISLVDHLRATEISESNVVILRAHAPVPTYWQVGILSRFNGTEWLPTSGVSDALTGSGRTGAGSLGPTPLPAPAAQQTFTAGVSITDFVSRLLPVPPATTAVHGVAGAAVIADEGVLAPTATKAGTAYTVKAGYDTTVPTGGTQLASSDPRLAPYLALPAQPAVVSELAHQAVQGATTPAAEAQALVDWFRSGRFRYTLSPPATTGSDPLVQFLTVTKAGFCEQFAGAYGVLARALGIPTRLVVGFTTGKAGPGNTYTLTGADAHVWPQVYLGPAAGWVSVDPTPGTPFAVGVLSVSSSQTRGAGTTPTTAVPRTGPHGTPKSARHVATHTHPRHHGASRQGAGWWVLALGVVGALLVLAAAAIWVQRRRRAAHAAGLPPDQQVVRAWDHALVALRRRGLERRAAETPAEYAFRVRSFEDVTTESAEAGAVARLAALVELACYTPGPVTPRDAATAHSLASSIVAGNRHRSHRRRTSGADRMPHAQEG
jgi:hypothetical protein